MGITAIPMPGALLFYLQLPACLPSLVQHAASYCYHILAYRGMQGSTGLAAPKLCVDHLLQFLHQSYYACVHEKSFSW